MTFSMSKIKLKVQIIFFCVALIASEVQCLHEASHFDSSIYMKFPSSESNITLGDSSSSYYHLPILEWKEAYNPFPGFNCTLYTRDRKVCNFRIDMTEGYDHMQITKVQQLSHEQVAIAWYEYNHINGSEYEDHSNIIFYDMIHCQTVVKWNLYKKLLMLEFYEDEFQIIYQKEKCSPPCEESIIGNYNLESFNYRGVQIGETKPLNLDDSQQFRIWPAS